jgi:hypothetical protein
MQMQSRGRILLGDLLQPNGALRMPMKSHVLTSHGLSGKPLDHQTSITSVTASVCGERLQLLDQMFRGTALLELQFRWLR